MKQLEAEVRKIQGDGLLWGAGKLHFYSPYELFKLKSEAWRSHENVFFFLTAKLVPVAYKIMKLQISCVVEDDKVSIDWLTEQIQEIEDYVQSVDIAAFNKV